MNLNFIFGNFIFFSAFLNAQNSVKFENEFFPNKKYENINLTNSKSYMNFEGDKDFMEALKSHGISNPIVSETSINSISEIETKNEKNNQIPFVTFFKKVSKTQNTNGTETIEPDTLEGSYIYGYYQNRKFTVIDSIQSEKINSETKKILKSVIENATKGINYPENPMKIGDTFEQNLPMDFPFADFGKISFIVNTNYLLKEIKNDIAFFETKINFIMTSEIPNIELTSNGKGCGVVEYDIKNKFTTNNSSKYILDLHATLKENLKFHVKSESESKYTMKIKN